MSRSEGLCDNDGKHSATRFRDASSITRERAAYLDMQDATASVHAAPQAAVTRVGSGPLLRVLKCGTVACNQPEVNASRSTGLPRRHWRDGCFAAPKGTVEAPGWVSAAKPANVGDRWLGCWFE